MRRYQSHVDAVVAAVTSERGETAASMRRALVDGRRDEVPDAMRPYLDKVTQRPWSVTDDDVAGLLSRGYSDDQVFEATVAAAVGAALTRLERARALLREVTQ